VESVAGFATIDFIYRGVSLEVWIKKLRKKRNTQTTSGMPEKKHERLQSTWGAKGGGDGKTKRKLPGGSRGEDRSEAGRGKGSKKVPKKKGAEQILLAGEKLPGNPLLPSFEKIENW